MNTDARFRELTWWRCSECGEWETEDQIPVHVCRPICLHLHRTNVCEDCGVAV